MIPREKDTFNVFTQPTDYGQLESIRDLKFQPSKEKGEQFAWSPSYVKKVKTKSNISKLKPAWKQLETLDHELQHRGFRRFRELVWNDPSLRKRLNDKYEGTAIQAVLRYRDHPYIYYQSKNSKDMVPKWFTRQMKEIIDQEILPYFFDRIPSSKKS